MSNTKTAAPAGLKKASDRIEVWLTQVNNFRITARQVDEDERVEFWGENMVESRSMRGAQREVTGTLIADGYEPDGRWINEKEENGELVESSRPSRLSKSTGRITAR